MVVKVQINDRDNPNLSDVETRKEPQSGFLQAHVNISQRHLIKIWVITAILLNELGYLAETQLCQKRITTAITDTQRGVNQLDSSELFLPPNRTYGEQVPLAGSITTPLDIRMN